MKKKSVSFRAILIVGEGSIRRRFSRIISISLVIALALCALAVVKDVNDLGNSVSERVNVSYLDSDLIMLHYPRSANMGYLEAPFDKEKTNDICSKYEVGAVVPVYIQQENWLFSKGNRIFEGAVKQVNVSDFFAKRVMSFDISGRFIENDDEIIIGEDVAGYLFDGECIGGKVMLNDGTGFGVEMTIVGVNRTVNPFDRIYSVVSSEKIKELLRDKLDHDLENRMEVHVFYAENEFREIQVSSGGIYGKMSVVSGDEMLLYGSLPGSDDEIMISSEIFPYALAGFELPDGSFDELAAKEMAVKHNGLFKVNVSGVYESSEIGMKFMPSFIDKLKEIEPIMLEIYLPSSQDVSATRDRIEAEDGLECTMQLENLKLNVLQQTSFFKWALLLTGMILAVISIAMLGSFSKLSVLERKREIAIIKSLGASDIEVLLTLWFDSVFISVMSFAMAMVFAGIFTVAIPGLLPDLAFAEFGFPLAALALFAGVFFTAEIGRASCRERV